MQLYDRDSLMYLCAHVMGLLVELATDSIKICYSWSWFVPQYPAGKMLSGVWASGVENFRYLKWGLLQTESR